MMPASNRILLTASSLLCLTTMGASALMADTLPATGLLASAQAEAGKVAYEENCAGCHQSSLAGQGDAMPLAGDGFRLAWSGKSIAQLYRQIHDTMPMGMGASLPDQTYADIVAYILAVNGAKPGGEALSPATSGVRIGDVIGLGKVQQLQTESTARTERSTDPFGKGTAPAEIAAPAAGPGQQMVVGSIASYTDVTDAMLRSPPDQDWLMYRGGYRGWSYSSLDQIKQGNVDRLQLVWSWSMMPGGTQETAPLVHDGVLFLWNPGNVIQALRADTGDLLWENRIGPAPRSSFGAGSDANRAIALYKDKLYFSTHEARLYALDARTGRIVWQTDIGEPSQGFGNTTGGVVVVNGKVISGLTACGGPGSPADVKSHCYISAYDAETGKLAWKFTTVALQGAAGGETWNNLPDNKRAGGETWIPGTYDPDLNLMYWGTAQAKPWRRDMRGSGASSNLYTSNTIALDPDNGTLKWHFSHQPGETLDLDEAFERVLIDEKGRKVLLTIGKPGFLWKLDRETGKFLKAVPTVLNNVAEVDPKTGVPELREDIVKQKLDDWIASCPGPQGGHNWQSTSYHAPSNTLIVPLSQSCVLLRANGSQKLYPMPGTDGMLGRLSAFDAQTLEPKWTFQQRSSFLSSVLTTAGNIAFVGDFDRTFRAVDVASGQTLWKARLGTTVQGHPMTFSVNGKQYIAVTTGLGGGSPQQKPMELLPEVKRPMQGNELYVFALPDRVSSPDRNSLEGGDNAP